MMDSMQAAQFPEVRKSCHMLRQMVLQVVKKREIVVPGINAEHQETGDAAADHELEQHEKTRRNTPNNQGRRADQLFGVNVMPGVAALREQPGPMQHPAMEGVLQKSPAAKP